MTTLRIDIETYSSEDLLRSGVYRYAKSPDFEILLIGFAFDDGPVQVKDVKAEGPRLKEIFRQYLTDKRYIKTAFNANFERTCLEAWLGVELPAEQWRCTAVRAAMAGLPSGLDNVARTLGLSQQKDASGKALIKYFCLPCKPTKTNGMRTRNLPQHDLFRWDEFKKYCAQDVVVEREIAKALEWLEIPDSEQQLWALDQQINDRGVLVDVPMVQQALRIDSEVRERLESEAMQLTGLDNPNSTQQLKAWLSDQTGEEVATLRKADLPALMQSTDCDVTSRVVQIRSELSKSSVKKYEAMRNAVCPDGRVRGMLRYYGAARSGRWTGQLVQVQNLPQNHLSDLDLARQLVAGGDADLIELLYGNVPDVLSQLIRTAFIPTPGNVFAVADFSAIEARVIAWLSGEQWRIDVFNSHGKIYEASAAQMFGVPIESIKKGSDLRQKGKVAELALGYQGGPGALKAMGADKMGLDDKELERLVKLWRSANPAIVRLWEEVNDAAISALEGMAVTMQHGLRFQHRHDRLIITLPSGRQLMYMGAKITEGRYGKAITYYGTSQTTKAWTRIDTYGGKLVENIIQAIARDCLAVALLRVDGAGIETVIHVHDEIVAEIPQGKPELLDFMVSLMGQPISWAKGLPLRADGYITKYYKKD
jgi:DNA polymerase